MPSPPPYPKNKLVSKLEPKIFPSFIANFSIEFVNWCLNNYSDNDSYILDNFAGSSTSLISCTYYGMKSYGIELNPVWVIYSKARMVRYSNDLSLLIKDELKKIKTNDDLSYYYKDILEKSLSNNNDNNNEHINIIAAALLKSYRDKTNLIYRSNHSWPIIDNFCNDLPVYDDIVLNVNNILEHAKWMFKYYPVKTETNIIWGDSTNIVSYINEFTLLITSPPYLTRLDYIVSTRPEIFLLKLIDLNINEYDLRSKQIGTPVIEQIKNNDYEDLPTSCLSLFKDVENHKSKGSKNYYLPFFQNYFIKMNKVFCLLDDIGTNDAKIIMVIRDSWYKEIYISTSKLLSDILLGYDWMKEESWVYKIKSMILMSNPHSKKWRNNSDLYENIIVFKRV